MTTKPKSRKKSAQRQPVKHSKSFSGCWTCRARRVKCSEEQPECARCLKGGFSCGGYGIKLSWVDPTTQDREQNVRRVIGNPTVYDETSAFVRIDVDKCLEDVDDCALGSRCMTAGPFSVFSTVARSTIEMAKSEAAAEPPCLQKKEIPVSDPGWSANEDETIETVYSPSVTDYTSGVSAQTCSPDSHWCTSPTLQRRHLDLLPRPAEQRALIHHWTNFICWHLVPVDRHDNPFRSVFTPMAMMGLTAPSATSNASVALFHAICATAAYSRGQLLGDERNAVMLADKHYHLAITHLRHSLEGLNTQEPVASQRSSILATITTFSTMDMITGRSGEWRTHLQGAASWLSTMNSETWHDDRSSSTVYQGYLAVAALCNIDLPTSVDLATDSAIDGGQQEYLLDRFFGLTRPILANIMRMNALIKGRTAVGTDFSPEVLDDLEQDLYSQDPQRLELAELNTSMRQMTTHHAYIFYYASLVHFFRSLRRLPPDDARIQCLVKQAIERLEHIEVMGGDSIGCTLVWPPFIVACECTDVRMQQRILEWYVIKRRHGFMNLEKSKDIAMEVWQRRQERPDVDVKWQDVLKDTNTDIVLA
jgi:hypothetical protein